MPTCPHCRGEFLRRKQGKCPGCNSPIVLYKKEWFDERPTAPTTQLLDHFLKLYPRKNGGGHLVLYTSDRIKELSKAKRYLQRCGDDLDLAREAMTIQFTNSGSAWAKRKSISYCFHDLPWALGQARRIRQQQQQELQSSAAFVNRVAQRENVFA